MNRIRKLGPWFRASRARRAALGRAQTVTLDFGRLELLLRDFLATRAVRGAALGWAGLAAGVLAALVTADFSYKGTHLGLTGNQWKVLLIGVIIVAALGVVKNVWSAVTAPVVSDLMEELAVAGGAVPEIRAIFLLKRRGQTDRPVRLLAYRSASWGCWFLPNSSLNDAPSGHPDQLKLVLANQLGLAVDLLSMEEHEAARLFSSKYSVYHGRETSYHFRFYCVQIAAPTPQHLRGDRFSVGGCEFAWLTIPEMQGDAATFQHNGDLLKYIHERYQTLLVDPPDSLVLADDGDEIVTVNVLVEPEG
jgi:hypothetical protein